MSASLRGPGSPCSSRSRTDPPAPTSFLLVEDRQPPTLGRSARLVVSGLPPRGSQRVSYTVLPQTRGRYRLGPLSVDITDPFALTRQRLEFDERDELLGDPGDRGPPRADPTAPIGQSFGASRARQLFRTGEEYYTMRGYQEGDDLRRIHWPSVARTGALMIRQDESSKRASGLVFIDTRAQALGQSHSQAFERAVSVGATLGVMLARRGFALRLGTRRSAGRRRHRGPLPRRAGGHLARRRPARSGRRCPTCARPPRPRPRSCSSPRRPPPASSQR